MKKILTLTLAAVMAIGLSVTSFAFLTVDTSSNMIAISDPVDGAPDYYLPGQTYIFPLTTGNADVTKEFYEDFRTSVKVTEGKSHIDVCDIRRRTDGTYALYVRAKKSSSYIETETVEITVTAIDKKIKTIDSLNRDGKYYAQVTLEVGFPQPEYVNSYEHTVTNDMPIVEFAPDLEKCTISFGYAAEYDAKFSKKTNFNLSFSEEENSDVVKKNPNATMTFISFPAKPLFQLTSEFRIDDSNNAKYVYEITDKGLKNISVTKKNGSLAFKTDQLTAYVASDIALNNVKIPSSSSSSKGDSTPPTGGEASGTPVSSNTVLNATNTALAGVAKGQTAYPTFQNASSVSAATIKSANAAAVNAGKKVMLTFDTVKDRKVVGRYYIDTAKSANVVNDIKVGITADNASVRAVFNKYYTNKFAIANLEQKAPFGMTVSVAVKLDLSQLNTNTLKFYAYDAKLNRYDQITPAYSVDSIGYLYFDTALGGDIVITDKTLALR